MTLKFLDKLIDIGEDLLDESASNFGTHISVNPTPCDSYHKNGWEEVQATPAMKTYQKPFGEYDLRVNMAYDKSEVIMVLPNRKHSDAPSFASFWIEGGFNEGGIQSTLSSAEKTYAEYKKGKMWDNRGLHGYPSYY